MSLNTEYSRKLKKQAEKKSWWFLELLLIFPSQDCPLKFKPPSIAPNNHTSLFA